MRLALAVVASVVVACQTPSAAAPPGFEKVSGDGYSVTKPSGWVLESPSPGRLVVRDPNSSATAAVSSVVYSGPLEKAFTQADPLGKGAKLVRQEPTVVGTHRGVSAQYTMADKRANVVAIDGGGVVTLFVAAASEADFNAKLSTLVQVLDTYRIVPAKKEPGKAPQAMRFEQWTDPRERAYATEVPVGYNVQGGLMRVGAIGTKILMQAASADNAVQVFIGDMSTGRFILPSEVVCSLGNCNGQPMPNGDIVAPFAHASDTGANIARQRFGNVQFTGRAERNDLVQLRRSRQPQMQGSNTPLSAADIQFTLADGRAGTATIVNSGFDVPGLGGAWYVDEFYGFVAPKDRAHEGATALAHMIGAMRTNPQWLAAELRSQAAASEQYLAYQRESASLQQRTIEQRWASQDRNNAEFRDVLTNTQHLIDPRTHERIDVQSTDRYFFRPTSPGGANTVVTTQQDVNPAPFDLQRLLQVESTR